jgi:hypothetical protein
MAGPQVRPAEAPAANNVLAADRCHRQDVPVLHGIEGAVFVFDPASLAAKVSAPWTTCGTAGALADN